MIRKSWNDDRYFFVRTRQPFLMDLEMDEVELNSDRVPPIYSSQSSNLKYSRPPFAPNSGRYLLLSDNVRFFFCSSFEYKTCFPLDKNTWIVSSVHGARSETNKFEVNIDSFEIKTGSRFTLKKSWYVYPDRVHSFCSRCSELNFRSIIVVVKQWLCV